MKSFLLGTVLFTFASVAYSQSGDPAVGGVLNGASFATGQPVAPGSLVSVFGSNFASGLTSADTIPLSVTLANVSVAFNGVPAPMVAVIHSSGFDQLNVQLPWNVLPAGVASGTAQMVVNRGSASSAPTTVQIASTAPGLFNFLDSNAGIFRPVAYNNADATFAFPVGAIPGVTTHPAKVNDPTTLVLLATGLGPVTTTPGNGAAPSVLSTTTTNPTVLIGNVPAQIIFSGLSPQFPGVYQINVQISPGTPTGNAVPIQISMGGITTSNTLTIAVSN